MISLKGSVIIALLCHCWAHPIDKTTDKIGDPEKPNHDKDPSPITPSDNSDQTPTPPLLSVGHDPMSFRPEKPLMPRPLQTPDQTTPMPEKPHSGNSIVIGADGLDHPEIITPDHPDTPSGHSNHPEGETYHYERPKVTIDLSGKESIIHSSSAMSGGESSIFPVQIEPMAPEPDTKFPRSTPVTHAPEPNHEYDSAESESYRPTQRILTSSDKIERATDNEVITIQKREETHPQENDHTLKPESSKENTTEEADSQGSKEMTLPNLEMGHQESAENASIETSESQEKPDNETIIPILSIKNFKRSLVPEGPHEKLRSIDDAFVDENNDAFPDSIVINGQGDNFVSSTPQPPIPQIPQAPQIPNMAPQSSFPTQPQLGPPQPQMIPSQPPNIFSQPPNGPSLHIPSQPPFTPPQPPTMTPQSSQSPFMPTPPPGLPLQPLARPSPQSPLAPFIPLQPPARPPGDNNQITNQVPSQNLSNGPYGNQQIDNNTQGQNGQVPHWQNGQGPQGNTQGAQWPQGNNQIFPNAVAPMDNNHLGQGLSPMPQPDINPPHNHPDHNHNLGCTIMRPQDFGHASPWNGAQPSFNSPVNMLPSMSNWLESVKPHGHGKPHHHQSTQGRLTNSYWVWNNGRLSPASGRLGVGGAMGGGGGGGGGGAGGGGGNGGFGVGGTGTSSEEDFFFFFP